MSNKSFVYVGTWTVQAKRAKNADGGGIGIYSYNSETGKVDFKKVVRPDLCAGQMCVDNRRGVLYAVDEVENSPAFGVGGGGRVVAFRIDPETGNLTELGDERSTLGTLPAFVALNPTGDWLVVANHGDKGAVTKTYRSEDGHYHITTEYSTVTAVLYPVNCDGSIGEAVDVLTVSEDRSTVPPTIASLHYCGFTHDPYRFITTNIRQDEVILVEIDPKNCKLHRVSSVRVGKGENPRYAVLNPERRVFYINDEHAEKLNVIGYDDIFSLKLLQNIDIPTTSEEDLTGVKIMQSDIMMTPDKKHVYTLYRGTNTVWIFDVGDDGLLAKRAEYHIGGLGGPRGGEISPNGKFMLVADNARHLVYTLKILEDGGLEKTSEDGSLKYPGVVRFYAQ